MNVIKDGYAIVPFYVLSKWADFLTDSEKVFVVHLLSKTELDYRELAVELGYKSEATVKRMITTLQNKGVLILSNSIDLTPLFDKCRDKKVVQARIEIPASPSPSNKTSLYRIISECATIPVSNRECLKYEKKLFAQGYNEDQIRRFCITWENYQKAKWKNGERPYGTQLTPYTIWSNIENWVKKGEQSYEIKSTDLSGLESLL